MSVTSGFFNSLNGDRRYNSQQLSALFDGVINDGVFASVGTAFGVRAASGNSITVGIGRAWFNSTWLLNDAILSLTADASEVLLHRYDAVVIEINHSDAVRDGTIKIIKGTPSSTPQRPAMTKTTDVHQYPLAYIYREANSSEILQADITNMIGTSSCPFVTGILQVVNIDNIVAQWQSQWAKWFTQMSDSSESEFNAWMSSRQLEFNTWFANLQTILDGDTAANMAEQILELQSKFKVLAKQYCIFETVQDSSGNAIIGSDESEIEGKIVYQIK